MVIIINIYETGQGIYSADYPTTILLISKYFHALLKFILKNGLQPYVNSEN